MRSDGEQDVAFGKLRAQDVIVSVDGVAVKSPVDAVKRLQGHEIGDTVAIGFLRGRSKGSVRISLAP